MTGFGSQFVVFVLAVGALVAGYFLYGGFVARLVRPDPRRVTPAIARADGVDYVAMPTWRVYLIQLLNIAGLGPVFGPIMGALWGPQVFLWIVLGSIFGGAVHDFLSGVMSIRNNGAGLPDLIGHYLGRTTRHFATAFILLLMVLVGTVFVKGPAALIVTLVPREVVGGLLGDGAAGFLSGTLGGQSVWMSCVMGAIFLYYLAATLLPIDKLIGRVYPIFALALLVMVAGLGFRILTGHLALPEFTLANLHPNRIPAWPIIFITVSCGAISGFHATQSPLMARCLKSEKHMRVVFYGAMIMEGLIAVVWAAASAGHYGGAAGLAEALGPKLNDTSVVVHTVCTSQLGAIGGVLAILGVVVLPITSGDTAFRVGRLIVADYLKLPQTRILNRYLVAVPLFALSAVLNFVPFGIIWRYFGWANQTLAAVTLWAAAVFLAKRGSWWWLAALPAVFMTVMTSTYVLVESRENGCVGLDHGTGTTIGIVIGLAALALFLWKRRGFVPEPDEPAVPGKPTAAERESDRLAC
jgi:carbon starvation protein CstA